MSSKLKIKFVPYEKFKREGFKSFMKDPIGTARTQAMAAMDELRKERSKGARPN